MRGTRTRGAADTSASTAGTSGGRSTPKAVTNVERSVAGVEKAATSAGKSETSEVTRVAAPSASMAGSRPNVGAANAQKSYVNVDNNKDAFPVGDVSCGNSA